MGIHDQNGRSLNRDGHDRDEDFGQGQSGYAAGRDDRAFRSRNQPARPGTFDDPDRGFGLDDRWGRGEHWTDRDTRPYDPERYTVTSYGRESTGYGYGDRDRGGFRSPNLGTGGYQGPRGSEGRSWNPQDSYGREQIRGPHRGKGPASYQRSDERIRDNICEAFTENEYLDATNIEVAVRSGEVTLTGTVDDRASKRLAEDIAERSPGVRDIQNQIKLHGEPHQSRGNPSANDSVSPSKHRA